MIAIVDYGVGNLFSLKSSLAAIGAEAVVTGEASGFVFPEGTTTFLCPQSRPMGGFARTSPSYETGYALDDQMGKNGYGEGYSFPCLFKNGDKGWMVTMSPVAF